MKKRRLKKLFSIIIFIVLFSIVGLHASASPLFGDRFERTLGSSAVLEITKQYGGEYIVPVQQRLWLDEVFRRLVEVTERKELEYTLTVLNSPEYNAFSLPGGYIFITQGLLKAIGSDESQLGAVLGHEIAHVEKRHGVNGVLRQMGLTVLMEVGVLYLDLMSADLLRVASATLLQLLQLGWGREAEYEADALGQSLAVQAGFDAIGAVSSLDSLLDMNVNSVDLPMKVFRTHPDTNSRRNRVAEKLVSFWSEPSLVSSNETIEKLSLGRNYDQHGRSDPKGRFIIKTSDSASQMGLEVYDSQSEKFLVWLEDVSIKDFAWSPQGQYLAVIVEQDDHQIWLCDRFGYVLTKRLVDAHWEIQGISWSPQGEMLALDLRAGSLSQIVVTYVETEVYVVASGDLGGKEPIWNDQKLYFLRNNFLYYTEAPLVRPVVIPNPIPQVLQRKRILSPTIIREDDTIRLTRPSLTLP